MTFMDVDGENNWIKLMTLKKNIFDIFQFTC